MSVSFEQKPHFIEPLIQVGSAEFFLSFSKLLELSAMVERQPSSITLNPEVKKNIHQSASHMSAAVDVYTSLGKSLDGLPVSPKALKISRNTDFTEVIANGVSQNILIDNPDAKAFISRHISEPDPVSVINEYTGILINCLESIRSINEDDIVYSLHVALSSCTHALVVGQHIAYVNRITRQKVVSGEWQ